MKCSGNGLLRKSLLWLSLLMFFVLLGTSCGGGSNVPQGSGGTVQQAQGGGDTEEASVLGLWELEGIQATNEFFPDGRMISISERYTLVWYWSSTGGRMLITPAQESPPTINMVSSSVSYTVTGNTMTRTRDDGSTETWTRIR